MGRDKALLPLKGTAMSLALAKKYEPLGPVCFSVDCKGRFPVGCYGELVDRFPGCGPLNGIVSAFLDTKEDVIFLTATDMPGTDTDAVRCLLEHLNKHDACIYRGEPLFGVYRRSCLDEALRCLEEGRYSMRGLLGRIDALELTGSREISNLNTPEEFARFVDAEEVL